MRKAFCLFIMSLIVISFVSCQSKEEKAAELIKKELSKTLYDFDSYQPIETTVTEAKMTMYNDSACWNKARIVAYGMKEVKKYLDEAKDAEEHMEIWGEPSYYSSSYSDRQYYKYKAEFKENLDKAQLNLEACRSLVSELKEQILGLDTTKVTGWEVKHRFRCKTKGGNMTIGDYRYILDKNFKEVLLREDMDDDEDTLVRAALESALDGTFD